MPSEIFIPTSHHLSIAWAEVFLKLMDRGVEELTDVMVTVTEFDEQGVAKEITAIRRRLDQELAVQREHHCHTVANTIFPQNQWNAAAKDGAKRLYERYTRIWPSIAKCGANRQGVYFQRLIAYAPKDYTGEPVNQLQHVIDTYHRGNHRRSALQASVFDPTRDHSHSRRLGFPCLQQVAFTRVEKNGLRITGFYPMQYAFERAYGNYVGLCRLGRFMATQMGSSLTEMQCIATVATLGGHTKAGLQGLAEDVRQILTNIQGDA
jgi:thymidylate synthase